MSKSASAKGFGKKVVLACTCRSCGRELFIHKNDTAMDAVRRAKWSNVYGDTGICRPCKKRGTT